MISRVRENSEVVIIYPDWVNYNDLTATSLEIVNYCNLLRYMFFLECTWVWSVSWVFLGGTAVEWDLGQSTAKAKTLQKLSDVVNAEMQQWWANVYEEQDVLFFPYLGHAQSCASLT